MKKIILSTLLAGMMLPFCSCSDSDQQEPWIQWYPVVTLDGDETCRVEMGSDWTLPGFTAVNTLTGEDASSAVEVLIHDILNNEYVSSIDVNNPGMYTVYYNSYGSEVATDPSVTKTRTVYVYDSSVDTDLTGTYIVNADNSFRVRYTGASAGQSLSFAQVAEANGNDISAGIPVKFEQVVPGIFYVDDIEAGLVSFLYGYGPRNPSFNFQMHAYVSLSKDNELSLLTTTFGYSPWAANYAIADFNGQYDPQTGVITYSADLSRQGFNLDVVLEP